MLNIILIHMTTWLILENILLSERSQHKRPHVIWFYLCEISRIGKSLETESVFLLHYRMAQFSRSVVSNTLWPHEPQHARPPCPSPTPGVHPNPCLLSWWCHPTVSSSVVPFSSCPQSFPPSGSFLMSQLFASGGQSIGVSASTSVLPMNTQDWSPLGWTDWISLQSKGLSRVFVLVLWKMAFIFW